MKKQIKEEVPLTLANEREVWIFNQGRKQDLFVTFEEIWNNLPEKQRDYHLERYKEIFMKKKFEEKWENEIKKLEKNRNYWENRFKELQEKLKDPLDELINGIKLIEEGKAFEEFEKIMDGWTNEQVTRPSPLTYDIEELKSRIRQEIV